MAPNYPANPYAHFVPDPAYHPSAGKRFSQGLMYAFLGTTGAIVLAVLASIAIYIFYARDLPSPQELHQRVVRFQSTRIYDRNGILLYDVFDPEGGRRTLVKYDQISPWVIKAVVATEDRTFFSNPGFSIPSILRAIYQNLRARRTVSGASTITQQLVKNVFLSTEQSMSRKIREAILAGEITRRYSKEEILEAYLNEVYFGNLAYGINAAAESYYSKKASDLTLAESALIAGLLQSPAMYDPCLYPDAALERRRVVLDLMVTAEYITQAEADAAAAEPLGIIQQTTSIQAPHLVMYVRELIEAQYGTEALYKGGLQVYTTLDLGLQREAERIVAERVAVLADYHVTNGSLVAIDPRNGDVLAMVGSADFNNAEISGQVNIARSMRQPGSTIKPFTFLAAFEKGWTPATMLMDVEQDFPDGANEPFHPTNVDMKELGPISLRVALATSRNIPAVYTLQQVGIPALIEMMFRFGVDTLTADYYGLSLTLGGGEVSLLQMTAAYAGLANEGRLVTPRTVLRIESVDGQVLIPDQPFDQPQVVDNRLAYLITDILSDNEARSIVFGVDNPLVLGFPAAAKTGTTNDYRDGYTIGYTPDLVTGVWVGNADYSEMKGVGGSFGAGPIWHDFMLIALANSDHPDFQRPEGIVELEVCALSGMLRNPDCPSGKTELFAVDYLPKEPCTVHVRQHICTVSNKLANTYCPLETVQDQPVEDYGPQWDDWLAANGNPVPGRETCDIHTAPSNVEISAPSLPLSGIAQIRGSTQVDGFDYYIVEYGEGTDPIGWGTLTGQQHQMVVSGVLMRWDTRTLPDGVYTLRVVVHDQTGHTYEARVIVEILNNQPTPTPEKPTLKPEEKPSHTPKPTKETPTPAPPTVTPEPDETATSVPPPPTEPPTSTATTEPAPTLPPEPEPATETPVP
ncbi:MAG: PBP1A family penicillin-binding protein [Chloroflexi bacterium]|nr:PBP1A family penicillin-binding protein [Chloroflexota bacterium]